MNSMKRFKKQKVSFEQTALNIHGRQNVDKNIALKESFKRSEEEGQKSTDLIEVTKSYTNKVCDLLSKKEDVENEIMKGIETISKSFTRISIYVKDDIDKDVTFPIEIIYKFLGDRDCDVDFENIFYSEVGKLNDKTLYMSYPLNPNIYHNGDNITDNIAKCHKCKDDRVRMLGYVVAKYFNGSEHQVLYYPIAICDGKFFASDVHDRNAIMNIILELYSILPILFPIKEDHILISKTPHFGTENGQDTDKPNVIYPKADRYIYLNPEYEDDEILNQHFYHRHTDIWWVRGHQRKCSDGKTTWVKGHWRGPDKELGENSPDIKTRVRKLPELLTIDESDTTAFSFSEDEIEEDDGFYLDD